MWGLIQKRSLTKRREAVLQASSEPCVPLYLGHSTHWQTAMRKGPFRKDFGLFQTFSNFSPPRSLCLRNFLSGSSPLPKSAKRNRMARYAKRKNKFGKAGEKKIRAISEVFFFAQLFVDDGFDGVLRENQNNGFWFFFLLQLRRADDGYYCGRCLQYYCCCATVRETVAKQPFFYHCQKIVHSISKYTGVCPRNLGRCTQGFWPAFFPCAAKCCLIDLSFFFVKILESKSTVL